MLLSGRHQRRRSNMLLATEQPASRLWLRIGIGIVILILVWLLGSKLLSIFDFTVLEKTSARLQTEQSDDVLVSLQGGEPRKGEDDLKLYDGDAVFTSTNNNATLTFFDGSRVRLDANTELELTESSVRPGKVSTLTLTLKKGKIVMSTPSSETYSGAIIRRIDSDAISATVPGNTIALIADDQVVVTKSAGLGVTLTLTIPDASAKEMVVGEGQELRIPVSALKEIAAGRDPYDYRDPIGADTLRGTFLSDSLTRLNSVASVPTIPSQSGGTVTSASPNADILFVESPANNMVVTGDTVKVSGSVGARVDSVVVNGYDIAVSPDLHFSQELALPADKPSVTLNIEARDAQGMTLAQTTRTVSRTAEKLAAPTVTAPVGSGQTLTTQNAVVTLRGTAGAGTDAIMVNDYKLQLFKAGDTTWTYIANANLGNMNPGKNIFAVVALDSAGNRSATTTITVDYQPDGVPVSSSAGSSSSSIPLLNNDPLLPGSLTVSKPVSGTTLSTSEKEVVLEGATSAETNAVFVNDYQLQLYRPGATFWNYIASTDLQTLKSGNNTYTVVARNAKGEVLDKLVFTITYTPAQ